MARAVVDGVGLEYSIVEARSASPGAPGGAQGGISTVALLNGIGMSVAHWRPVAERLSAAGYRVLLHDFRGQLLSERPAGPYSFEGHARDLAGLLDALGLGRVVAVGTSYGSEVALTFARDYPGRCSGVAAIDGVSEYDEVLRAAIECWKSAALADPRTFYKSLVPWTYSAEYLAGRRDAIAAREDAVAALPRDYFEGFARLCDAFLAIDLTRDLRRVTCPCLVAVGDRDILKPPRYSRIIAEGVPGARYVEVAGAGHALAIEKPDELSDLLLGFLSEAAACSSTRGMEETMVEKTVTVLGKSMRYVESGTGPAVVLVHGNSGSSRWWKRVMDLGGRRVIAPDLPNFGRSDALDTADIDLYADHLAAFVEALGLDRPTVVGHSLGGAVAMAMAARRPELPGALVLVDGAAPSGLVTPEAHYPYIELFRTKRDMMRQALAAVAPTMDDPAFLDELTDDAMAMAPHAFSGNARALARFDYTGRAGAFCGPVMVVWGRKDSIITEAMARETAAAYRNSRLLILDSVGHSVMAEDPELFKRSLLEFLASAD